MNDWLQRTANQRQQKNLSRTYVVAILADDPDKIIGYYTLARWRPLPSKMTGCQAAGRLPRKVSAVLLARLAVDRSLTGQGLGEYLLARAQGTVVATAEDICMQCVGVRRGDKAAGFYRKYGFGPFTDAPLRLLLPVATIRQA